MLPVGDVAEVALGVRMRHSVVAVDAGDGKLMGGAREAAIAATSFCQRGAATAASAATATLRGLLLQ